MTALAVFLFGASTLAYEVLLARFFLIAQHHHLQFMVLSIALLGTGASGTFLNLFSREKSLAAEAELEKKLPALVLGCMASAIAAYVVVNTLPIDYFRLALDPLQIIFLLLAFILFSLPFFAAGLATGLCYSLFPERTGKIYVALFAGSALGALFPGLLLPVAGMSGSILAAALLPAVLFLFLRGKRALVAGLIALVIAGAAIVFLNTDLKTIFEVQSSSYKPLPELVARTGSSLISRTDSVYGRIDVVESSSLRFAPGLSIRFRDKLPGQKAVFVDASSQTVLYGDGDEAIFEFARASLQYAGFLVKEKPEHILVIAENGGSGVVTALSSGAQEVALVDQNPERAALIRRHYHSPRLTVIDENARSFVAFTSSRFDVILIDRWGSSLPGLESLSEEYLLTLEAMQGYLGCLAPDGVVVVSDNLLLPPAGLMRLAATALSALSNAGVSQPERHLFVARGMGVFTLIVSKSELERDALKRLKDFAVEFDFDFVYYPGMAEGEANRHYVFPEPYFYSAVQTVLMGGGASLPFNANPTADDSPFFSRSIRWDRIGEYVEMTGGRPYALFVSGELVVVSVLASAVLLCLFLIVIPVLANRRRGVEGNAAFLLIYLFLGAGFMWIELGLISNALLLFSHPVAAFMIVLVLVFVSSGLGGLFSQRLGARNLVFIGLVLTSLVVVYALLGPLVIHALLGLPLWGRYVFFSLIVFPVGFAMGIPFPLSMRTLLENQKQRTFAWAVNGSASVLGAVLEMLAALMMGFRLVFMIAGIMYAGSAAIFFFISLKRKKTAEA